MILDFSYLGTGNSFQSRKGDAFINGFVVVR